MAGESWRFLMQKMLLAEATIWLSNCQERLSLFPRTGKQHRGGGAVLDGSGKVLRKNNDHFCSDFRGGTTNWWRQGGRYRIIFYTDFFFYNNYHLLSNKAHESIQVAHNSWVLYERKRRQEEQFMSLFWKYNTPPHFFPPFNPKQSKTSISTQGVTSSEIKKEN